ncbi:meiosis-specific nuclear structural protein 1-like [Nasonia vitripennis]|uniref:Endonuclease-reverse transcriptase n=1 Tax=Nasonia vitripennis TaxID=7425 RepID=A0A7M7Q0W2_NASVI|nr:meiosis-specific nuclear structural protein 1-like [Nasonia vitripennis]
MTGRPKKLTNEDVNQEEKRESKTRSAKNTGDSKQPTLDSRVKKLAFSEKEKNFKENIENEVKKIRLEALEIEKMKTEMKERELRLVERVEKVENKMKELEERINEREIQWRETIDARLEELSIEGATGPVSLRGSTRSLASGASAGSDQTGVSNTSRWSRVSFSDRDVMQMKRMLVEKERSGNQNVIVIKGLEIDENKEPVNATVVKFLKDKLNVEIIIGSHNIRVKAKVIVIRLRNANDKETIMQNKNKLAETKLFIDHYRSYEERKRQEEISAWVREKKEKGLQLKTGFGKILYKDTWVRWEDKERLLERIAAEEKRDNAEKRRVSAERNNVEVRGEKLNDGLSFH